jgi:hypothetical protein
MATMRRLAFVLLAAACSRHSGGGGDETTGGGSSSTTAPAVCDVVDSCESCWKCAKADGCKAQYDACASSSDCAGSLACIDYKCPPEGIQQDCVDQCCLNCAEHFICATVDAAVSCIEMQCAEYCASQAVCGM